MTDATSKGRFSLSRTILKPFLMVSGSQNVGRQSAELIPPAGDPF